MPSVLQMTQVLSEKPAIPAVAGLHIRNIRIPDDIENWLQLRTHAFASERKNVRPWSHVDFNHEFLQKPWWRAEAMWIAEENGLVGSVTLARRESASGSKPVVHWLLVDPNYRRRGIGRLLLAKLEAAVWDAGERQIWLDTHSDWENAVQFYTRMGYRCC